MKAVRPARPRSLLDGDDLNRILEILGPDLLSLPLLRFFAESGGLTEADVVEIELARLQEGIQLTSAEEKLALLLSDELSSVTALLAASRGQLTDEERESVLLVRLMGLRDRWDDLTQPGFYVESEIDDWAPMGVYDDVRFSVPPPPGQRGMAAYLTRLDQRIAERLHDLRQTARASRTSGYA